MKRLFCISLLLGLVASGSAFAQSSPFTEREMDVWSWEKCKQVKNWLRNEGFDFWRSVELNSPQDAPLILQFWHDKNSGWWAAVLQDWPQCRIIDAGPLEKLQW